MHPLRARDPLVLRSNPIVLALAQVVISAVLDIERYIPTLQEVLRKCGYPRYERVDLQTIRFDLNGGPGFNKETKWVFSDRDRTRAVSISPTFIVFEETVYTSFDQFIDRVEDLIGVVNNSLQIDFLERVGFRRVNLIESNERLETKDLVRPGIRGINASEFGRNDQRSYEHWMSTDAGRLMVRLICPAPEQIIPPELAATTVTIRKPATGRVPAATLDIDHFAVGTADFDAGRITEQLWRLHDASDQAFRASVTDEALELWRT